MRFMKAALRLAAALLMTAAVAHAQVRAAPFRAASSMHSSCPSPGSQSMPNRPICRASGRQ